MRACLLVQKAGRIKAQKVLDAMVDPYVVLGMTCIVPLLECINVLIKFAQQRNVYICDFVGGLITCQVEDSSSS
jgi:hypothetical protein